MVLTNISVFLKNNGFFLQLISVNRLLIIINVLIFLLMTVTMGMGSMIALVAFADNLERALGKTRYLLLYFFSGIGAGVISMTYHVFMQREVVAAGASGAIFGVIGAWVVLMIRNRGRFEKRMLKRMVLMFVYVLYSGFTTPGIDNAAHVGGLLMGILFTVFPQKRARGKRGKV